MTSFLIGAAGGSALYLFACNEVRKSRIADHVRLMHQAYELGVKAGQEEYWRYDGGMVPKDPGVVGYFNPRAKRAERLRANEDCATVAFLRGKAEGWLEAAKFDMHDGFTDLLNREAA